MRIALVSAVVATAVAWSSSLASPPVADHGDGFMPARQAVVQVTVNARCAGPNTTEITVRPWNARLRQGDEIDWVIAANANSNELTVTPKSSSDWPFATRGPYNARKGTPARANRMRGNGRGTYKYDIMLVCQSGQNAPDTVVVDPDIIVD